MVFVGIRLDVKDIERIENITGITGSNGKAVKQVVMDFIKSTEPAKEPTAMVDPVSYEIDRIGKMTMKDSQKELHNIIVNGAYGEKNFWETVGRVSGGTPSRFELIRIICHNAIQESGASREAYLETLQRPMVGGIQFLKNGIEDAIAERNGHMMRSQITQR